MLASMTARALLRQVSDLYWGVEPCSLIASRAEASIGGGHRCHATNAGKPDSGILSRCGFVMQTRLITCMSLARMSPEAAEVGCPTQSDLDTG